MLCLDLSLPNIITLEMFHNENIIIRKFKIIENTGLVNILFLSLESVAL